LFGSPSTFCLMPDGAAASDFFTSLGRGKCHGTSAVSLFRNRRFIPCRLASNGLTLLCLLTG